LLIGRFWYHSDSWILRKFKVTSEIGYIHLKWHQWLLAFLMSGLLVYGYMNLVIHQMGFYELFFTDIMMGKEASKLIVEEFLGKYGQKHRSFGHGVFHGAINAVVFCLPFVVMHTFLDKKESSVMKVHFTYWLVTSMIIGGLISEFV